MFSAWIGDLNAYNCGSLHGFWLQFEDLQEGYEHCLKLIQDMQRESPEPGSHYSWEEVHPDGGGTGYTSVLKESFGDWEIFDYESEIGDLGRVSLDTLCAIAEGLLFNSLDDEELFLRWLFDDYLPQPLDIDDEIRAFEDSFMGVWNSWEEYAENMAEQLVDWETIPDFIKYHWDASSFGRDLELCGDFRSVDYNNRIALFSTH